MSATCQCDETGDNPKCFAHGDGSQWALRQQVNDLLRERAALKAENEALKTRCEMVYCAYCSFEARCPTDNKALTDHVKVCEFHPVRKLEAELKRYTSWTPQDPGTKEAMAFADALTVVSGPPARVKVLAHALRAAMVRLEEAEKNLRQLQDAVVNPTRRPE